MEARAGRGDRPAPVGDADARRVLGRGHDHASRGREPRRAAVLGAANEHRQRQTAAREALARRVRQARVRGARRRGEIPDRLRPAEARRDVRRQDPDGRQHRSDPVAAEPHAPAEERDVRAGLRQRLRADPQGLRAVLRPHRGGADGSQRALRRTAAVARSRRHPARGGRSVRRGVVRAGQARSCGAVGSTQGAFDRAGAPRRRAGAVA